MPQLMTTLATDRLTLRPQTLEDFPAYEALLASKRSAGMGGPFDKRTIWGFFCGDLAMRYFFGHGALMVELTKTRECVGQVSINHGPLFREKELGWFLYDGYEGHGYATEAARALRDWAFETLDLRSLVSYVAPDNFRSTAVAMRLGGILDTSALRDDPEDLVYRYSKA
ncbi:GNAT family N-acetyltransferase [Rhizobium yanglingense]